VVLLKSFIHMFNIAELRKKILFTLGILIVYRIGMHIPVIGVDIDKLAQLMSQTSRFTGFLSYIDLFSGGNLRQCTLFALGIMPYITASILMQFITLSFPYFEALSKEGEHGRKVINQYTRYLALGVAIFQSSGFVAILERYGLVIAPGWGSRILFVLFLSVGSSFVMWLGEQISLFGLGNGSSILIFAGIVSRFPDDVVKVIVSVQEGYIDLFVGIFIFALALSITACIVFLEKGDRKIPVHYAKRVVGNKMYGGQSTYIPFKINVAGVMPVIFASSILNIPMLILPLLASYFDFFKPVADSFVPGSLVHGTFDFVLIILFSFFYTAVIFNPEELAQNIKKQGGFIPGIRPGRQTAEFFNHILTRLGLIGAVYLAFLALLPTIVQHLLSLSFYLSGIMSGTALLIAVGVALETASQIESYLIEHRYEGFLTTGRMKGRALGRA
jgi:preprotein translocase subunit SecY